MPVLFLIVLIDLIGFGLVIPLLPFYAERFAASPQEVTALMAVFSLMSSRRIWVEANFRETALTHMHPGESASISVDAYPGHPFSAHVISMSPGTGSDFSVLPPENATGNWVKVIQRLPVRLELDQLDPTLPLYSGISVTVRVDTGDHAGWRHPLRVLEAAL